MIENQILKQVEELPTLVNKLRFVEETFPTEGDVLEKAFQEALTLSLKRQFPLFAEQIKPSEPRKLSAEATTETVAELRWLEPTDSGGGMIVGYRIERKLEGILTGFSDLFESSGYKVAPTVAITGDVGAGATAKTEIILGQEHFN